jgi:hypothetical protein
MSYDPTEKDLHVVEPAPSGAHGIIFQLPSHRRYIPYAWLLYADINREETEVCLQFTHSTVIVRGISLKTLHDWASTSILGEVRESSPTVLTSPYPIVRRIEITEKTEE